MHPASAALLGLALAFGSGPAAATTWSLAAILDGAQETPPNASPASGTASLTFDDVTNVLNWTITYSGLLGGTNNAHFHGPAGPGVPASPVINITFTSGLTAATLTGSATLTATQETWLLSNLLYINIHSTAFPGGEIRGQVNVVPEPATLGLMALGLGALAAGRRRRG
jgi:hypothetical protein